jgi:hypothetical protein
MTILGYLEATQATAGTWATAPSRIQLMQPGDARPGDILQHAVSQSGAVATGTTVLPFDDTIPQNTEGNEYMSKSITPTSEINLLKIDHYATYSSTAVNNLGVALFQDSTASALAANVMLLINAGSSIVSGLSHFKKAGTVSSTTFKIRAGGNNAGTTTFNGANTARVYGGVGAAYLSIQEIMA